MLRSSDQYEEIEYSDFEYKGILELVTTTEFIICTTIIPIMVFAVWYIALAAFKTVL